MYSNKEVPPSFPATRGDPHFQQWMSPSTYMAAMNLGPQFCIETIQGPLTTHVSWWQGTFQKLLFHWTLCTPVHRVSLNVLQMHRSYRHHIVEHWNRLRKSKVSWPDRSLSMSRHTWPCRSSWKSHEPINWRIQWTSCVWEITDSKSRLRSQDNHWSLQMNLQNIPEFNKGNLKQKMSTGYTRISTDYTKIFPHTTENHQN